MALASLLTWNDCYYQDQAYVFLLLATSMHDFVNDAYNSDCVTKNSKYSCLTLHTWFIDFRLCSMWANFHFRFGDVIFILLSLLLSFFSSTLKWILPHTSMDSGIFLFKISVFRIHCEALWAQNRGKRGKSKSRATLAIDAKEKPSVGWMKPTPEAR